MLMSAFLTVHISSSYTLPLDRVQTSPGVKRGQNTKKESRKLEGKYGNLGMPKNTEQHKHVTNTNCKKREREKEIEGM